jgi:mRNA-degrading endonuclease YafQ of YafQ-DinJ toxin-antitoxin module
MRRIERAAAFRRDYRRVKAISRYRGLDARLVAVLDHLVNDRPLPALTVTMPYRETGRAIEIAIFGPTSC